MKTSEHVKEVLGKAEKELRSIMAGAATTATYDELLLVTDTARQVNALVQRLSGPLALASRGAPAHEGIAPSLPGRRAPAKGEYPKFEIRDGMLFKTGWSKKERSEYIHKAPLPVLEAVRQRLTEVATGKQAFTMNDVLPVPAAAGTGEIPTYQVYLCVAYELAANRLVKTGRDRYSCP